MQHIHMSQFNIIRIWVLDDRYHDIMFCTDSDKIQPVTL